MAIQIISNKPTSSIRRLVRVRRNSRVGALFAPAERNRGKEVDWEERHWSGMSEQPELWGFQRWLVCLCFD